MPVRVRAILAGAMAASLAVALPGLRAAAQSTPDVTLFRELTWRNAGPFQGGRTTSGAGVANRPTVFYIGTANGGVWKTTDAGQTWQPIFDDQPIGAIGAIAVAASDPNVIYAGTGAEPEGFATSPGGGVYRSTDGGRTWTLAGLRDAEQITSIVVDPRDAARVWVAVLGRPFAANPDRGVFRSSDGGRTWDKVLFKDADTGAADLALDPSNPDVLFAALWQSRWSPWEASAFNGPGSALYKSTDGGTTWHTLGSGLPTFAQDGLGRMTIAAAPANGRRVYAIVEATRRAGLYMSNDAGESWTFVSARAARAGGSRAGLAVDPRNADTVYVATDRVWKSTDAGRTFVAWRRDGGDARYESIWIGPADSSVVLVTGNRGAAVTVNGGDTWSSSLNQPTGRFAHVVTDAAFPYRICAAPSDAPAGCVPSRGDQGGIEPSDWQPIGTRPGGFVAPDPTDTDVVYSGALSRFDRRTLQAQDVTPNTARVDPTASRSPVTFAPTDSRTLLFATDVLWRSTTAGQVWTTASPSLGRDTWDVPATVGVFRDAAAARSAVRGTITALASSPVDGRTIWAGTDDGLVHVTRDTATTWTNVTPPDVKPWARVAAVEASRFDANTAYVAVDASRLDDRRSLVWRTRDGGVTWSEISRALTDAGVVYAVREDLFRRGLLFAATDRSVFASFDDGETWRPLRQNLPPVPVRDLTIREADLVAATDGRGFWVLDDLSPLRQITPDIARADAFLFRPATAWRVRAGGGTSALVAGEHAAPNPPDGALFQYLVGPNVPTPLTLEVIETITGDVIRRFSSDVESEGPALSTTPGVHRVVWDLRYTPVEGRSLPVMPGTYQVRLTVAGRALRQAVIVRIDSRLRTSTSDLTAQFKLSKALQDKRREIVAVRNQVRQGPATSTGSLAPVDEALVRLTAAFDALQQSDWRPTPTADAAANAAIEQATRVIADVR